MRYSTAMQLRLLCCLASGMAACGKKLTQSKTQAATAADDTSAGATVDDSARPQTITITDGELQGATLQVPAGALPEGSRIALKSGAQPNSFASAITSPEASGSPVVAVSITSADGTPIAAGNSGAISLSIPVTGDDSGYSLTPSARILANLVCLHQAPDQTLGFWRYQAFSGFDRLTKLATIKITRGGFYQLAYMAPEAPIEAFETATEQSAAAPITLAGFSCPDGLASFYEKAKDHPTFVSYYDLYIECTCRRGELTVEQCSQSVAAAFGSSMCVAPTEVELIDDAKIDTIYLPAIEALNHYCKN